MEDNLNEKLRFHYHENARNALIDSTDICRIYDRLIDDKSKMIFINRLLFSLTNDWRYIKNIVVQTDAWTEFDYDMSNKKKDIYIYGAGISGKRLPLIYPEYAWAGYVDRNKVGIICNGLRVYGIEKCRELSDDDTLILISNMIDTDEIKKDLIVWGIKEKNILTFLDYSRKAVERIYFDDYVSLENVKGKAFVDAGAFDGADTLRFLRWVKDDAAKAMVFEADNNNFQKVKKNLAGYPEVQLYNQGLSNDEGQQFFMSGQGEMSNFSGNGDIAVPMNFLDNVAVEEQIGYIKMDIEGYERQALSGAKKVISKQQPVLAISIYHKREDIWEIPKLILSLNSNYRFILRHYSLGVVDTVLYAV